MAGWFVGSFRESLFANLVFDPPEKITRQIAMYGGHCSLLPLENHPRSIATFSPPCPDSTIHTQQRLSNSWTVKSILRNLIFLLAYLIGALAPHAVASGKSGSDSTRIPGAGVYPLPILFYTPETGIAGGAAALYLYRDSADQSTRASSITGDVIYSEKKQIIVELNEDIYFDKGAYRLLSNGSYKRFPNSFYGIGNNNSSAARESYTSRAYSVKMVFYRNVYSRLNVAPLLRYESTSIVETKPGGLLGSGFIPGSGGGKVSGAGVVVNWDSRDNTFYAYSGGFYQLTSLFNSRTFGSDFAYSDFELDCRNFFELLPQQILAVQTKCSLMTGAIPFQNLSRFGGQDFIRGYFDGRYRDKTCIGAQVEYRIPIWWRIGASAFAGTAQVSDQLTRWRIDEFKFAGGAGLRFFLNPKERVAIRIDWGVGENSSGLYITVTEAF